MQPVDDAAYEAVVALGIRGGWERLVPGGKTSAKRKSAKMPEDVEEVGLVGEVEEKSEQVMKRKKEAKGRKKGSVAKKAPQDGENGEAKPEKKEDEGEIKTETPGRGGRRNVRR